MPTKPRSHNDASSVPPNNAKESARTRAPQMGLTDEGRTTGFAEPYGGQVGDTRRRRRKGLVYFQDVLAGELQETEDGYRFTYEEQYRVTGGAPIAFQFPVTQTVYDFERLPAFFDNLIAEGWLRRTQSQSQRIAEEDRFGLLLANGRDLIGAVTILPDR